MNTCLITTSRPSRAARPSLSSHLQTARVHTPELVTVLNSVQVILWSMTRPVQNTLLLFWKAHSAVAVSSRMVVRSVMKPGLLGNQWTQLTKRAVLLRGDPVSRLSVNRFCLSCSDSHESCDERVRQSERSSSVGRARLSEPHRLPRRRQLHLLTRETETSTLTCRRVTRTRPPAELVFTSRTSPVFKARVSRTSGSRKSSRDVSLPFT